MCIIRFSIFFHTLLLLCVTPENYLQTKNFERNQEIKYITVSVKSQKFEYFEWSVHIHDLFIWDEGKSQPYFSGASRPFSLQILHIVKSQISEMLDKYLIKILLSDDTYWNWPAFWPPFCLFFPKSVIPQFLAPEFVNCCF